MDWGVRTTPRFCGRLLECARAPRFLMRIALRASDPFEQTVPYQPSRSEFDIRLGR